MRPPRFLAFLCAITCALLAAPATRAADTATLSGVVYTAGEGQPQTLWPNARVTMRNLATGAVSTTVSDSMGRFRFVEVEAGPCELTVALAGFETTTRRIELHPRGSHRVNVALRPAGQTASVVITAEKEETVEPATQATTGGQLQRGELRALPLLNEFFQEALPLLPGVVRGPDGLLNIKGARSVQTGTLVNSTSVVDPVTGQAAISLPPEAVASVRVLSNPFSAAYGRFTAGITELETRGGTDRWRFQLTNFLPRLRRRDGSFVGIGAATPRLTFAGPLRRGQLYLFQSFDYRFVRTKVPSLPDLRNDRVHESFDSFTQLDWNINAMHRFTARLALYPQNLGFVTLDTFHPEPVTPNFRQRGYFLEFSERAFFSAGGYLDSSFSVKRFDAHVFPAVPAADPVLFLFPEQNLGAWHHRQGRESHFYQWAQTYHFRPLRARGTHLLQGGYLFSRARFEGSVRNDPVEVLRADGTASQRITWDSPGTLAAAKNSLAVFVQDRWQLHPRFSLDLGVRLDHDGTAGPGLTAAPRVAFVWMPRAGHRTAVRGGFGLFYEFVPLNLETFLDYPAQAVTRFAADGATVTDRPRTFVHRIATREGDLRVPYSAAWSLQVDHELARGWLLRLGYEQRETFNLFFVEPVVAGLAAELQLLDRGHQRYREFQGMLRWDPAERTTLFFSYVHSRAVGDLNDFNEFFGNFPQPVIRPNQRSLLPFDAPHRLLFWGSIGLPWKLDFTPVLDVHSGFPFSAVDEELNFVGRRNRAGRFPVFVSFDFQLARRFGLRLLGHDVDVTAGIRLFNVTGRFNPRDVQQNTASPDFGRFFNSIERKFRTKLSFDF